MHSQVYELTLRSRGADSLPPVDEVDGIGLASHFGVRETRLTKSAEV
jgi:hypothetical protein